MNKIIGTNNRPRASVFHSNRYISVALISDETGKTLISGTSKKIAGKQKPVEKAFMLGKNVAESAKKANISSVVFDRGNLRYHGQVRAVAEGLREGGINL